MHKYKTTENNTQYKSCVYGGGENCELFNSSSLRGGVVHTPLLAGVEGQRHGGVAGQADEDNSLDGASYPVCVVGRERQ